MYLYFKLQNIFFIVVSYKLIEIHLPTISLHCNDRFRKIIFYISILVYQQKILYKIGSLF